MGSGVVVLAFAVAWLLVWFGAVVSVFVMRWPRPIARGPVTEVLGPEPPAVANLLANLRLSGGPTPDAGPATLLDLAARNIVTVERIAPQRYAWRVKSVPSGLLAYEAQVVELIRDRLVDGIVPSEALTTGTATTSPLWRRRFGKAVIADAKARGLTRDILDAREVGLLVSPGPLGIAALLLAAGALRSGDAAGPLWIMLVFAFFCALAMADAAQRQRETPAGAAALRHWLGVRRHLLGGRFDIYGPDGVLVWGRHLACAAAFGIARAALEAVPMTAEDDKRAWSSTGGRWRQVRIRYPRFLPGWGRQWPVALTHGLIGAFLTGLLASFLLGVATDSRAGNGAAEGLFRAMRTVATVGGVAAGIGFIWFTVEVLSALGDTRGRRQLTGDVIRARCFVGGDDVSAFQPKGNGPRHFIAVDDGRPTRVLTAFRVDRSVYDRCPQGSRVALLVSPVLRHVELDPRGVPTVDHSNGAPVG